MVKSMAGNTDGYTLTELIIVVAILGLVSSVGYVAMQKTIEAQLMADAQSSIQQGAFTSFDTISKLLRQASASSVVIDRFDTNQPPWSRIAFTVPSTGRTFNFSQRGQTLFFANNPMLTNLRSLTFSYPQTNTPNVISLSMTFEKSTGSGRSKAIQLFIQKVKIQNS